MPLLYELETGQKAHTLEESQDYPGRVDTIPSETYVEWLEQRVSFLETLKQSSPRQLRTLEDINDAQPKIIAVVESSLQNSYAGDLIFLCEDGLFFIVSIVRGHESVDDDIVIVSEPREIKL